MLEAQRQVYHFVLKYFKAGFFGFMFGPKLELYLSMMDASLSALFLIQNKAGQYKLTIMNLSRKWSIKKQLKILWFLVIYHQSQTYPHRDKTIIIAKNNYNNKRELM